MPIVRVAPLLLALGVAMLLTGRAIEDDRRALSEDEARAFTGRLRRAEPSMRATSRSKFRDEWSRGDDFANAERALVRAERQRRGVRISDLLAAIDADVRATKAATGDDTRGRVPPCVPRPFYD